MRFTNCRKCHALITFIRTPRGKAMPCDADQVFYMAAGKGKDVIVTPNGEIVRCEILGPKDSYKATGVGYVPHWATCPAADYFRKRDKDEPALAEEQESLF